jgi:hypothetical protein
MNENEHFLQFSHAKIRQKPRKNAKKSSKNYRKSPGFCLFMTFF